MGSRSSKIAVLGGGVAGLCVAFELLSSGFDVTVIDPASGSGASNVAAGMLAPASEANFGEALLSEIMSEAASYWQDFAYRLENASMESIEYRESGTLVIASDAGDLAYLKRANEYLAALGAIVQPIRRSALAQIEPLLSPKIAGAFSISGDRQVHNRKLLGALQSAVGRLGGRWITKSVLSITESNSGVEIGVGHQPDIEPAEEAPRSAPSGEIYGFDACVVAAGSQSSELLNLIGLDEIANFLMPVKGQILRVRSDPAYGPPSNVIRGTVNARPIYLVPRIDGEIVIGATMEEVGRDERHRIGAIADLLADAIQIMPSIREADLVESSVGYRPGTIDNLPVLGRLTERIWSHFGHYRHGILLSPLTAAVTRDALIGLETPQWYLACSAKRFEAKSGHSEVL